MYATTPEARKRLIFGCGQLADNRWSIGTWQQARDNLLDFALAAVRCLAKQVLMIGLGQVRRQPRLTSG